MKDKHMENNLNASIIVTNTSDEMFNDALYYRDMINKTDNIFLKRRYFRLALILFCPSAEAWMNTIIDHFEKESNNRGKYKKSNKRVIRNYKKVQ